MLNSENSVSRGRCICFDDYQAPHSLRRQAKFALIGAAKLDGDQYCPPRRRYSHKNNSAGRYAMPHDAENWEHFRHDADIGIRGRGATVGAAFEQAALAMTAVITDPAQIAQSNVVEVNCEAPDIELLFLDWLNALIFEMATRGLIFGKFAVAIDDCRLKGVAYGEPVDSARHEPAAEIKGATLSELAVRTDESGLWCAQCVVDV
jgi:SHS2 domain-containing protein